MFSKLILKDQEENLINKNLKSLLVAYTNHYEDEEVYAYTDDYESIVMFLHKKEDRVTNANVAYKKDHFSYYDFLEKEAAFKVANAYLEYLNLKLEYIM